MSAMRVWLDAHHVQPSVFRYEAAGDGELLLNLDFMVAGQAKGFALEFGHQHRNQGGHRRMLRHPAATMRPPLLSRRTRARAGSRSALSLAECRAASRPQTPSPCGLRGPR
jgi:hypothetical protein